jgi:uncharacterized flavoprotein (TIGR03862 family)
VSEAGTIAVIGGGPTGLMAAEAAAQRGARVVVYDAKASVGRKFLVAGLGGLNLTHSEPAAAFRARYGKATSRVAQWLDAFDADALRRWSAALGVPTVVGSSGRVFPHDYKAAPLLRAWLRRLRALGVQFAVHHRWTGWDDAGALRLETPEGEVHVHTGATVLALGGGSWRKLGSDGAWVPWLVARGIAVAPLVPSNVGFACAWSEHFRARHAGAPLKRVRLSVVDAEGAMQAQEGEMVLTDYGIEGQLVYALSAPLRDAIAARGPCEVSLDLLPQTDIDTLATRLAASRGKRSLSEHWRRVAGLNGARAGLVHEVLGPGVAATMQPADQAKAIKALPLRVLEPRPLDEAISSAGGVRLDEVDDGLMLRRLPGTWCAGEMLDWEAPTGGYLLTACMASGRVAGAAAAHWVARGD